MRGVLAGALLAVGLGAGASEPVSFVTDIRGNATVEGEGKLITFLAQMSPGSRLLLGSNAVVTIMFAETGAEFTARGPGEFLVTPTEIRAEKGAATKRREVAALEDPAIFARVARTATASLRMRGIVPRSDATASPLQFPVETRVATLQPTLRWRADAVESTVTVLDASGREVWKGRGASGSTRLPVALVPGSRYSWTLASPRGELGNAGFETLGAEAISRVESLRIRAKSFPERVVHAMLLQDLGAAQEAREAWGTLARERPDLPELAAFAR